MPSIRLATVSRMFFAFGHIAGQRVSDEPRVPPAYAGAQQARRVRAFPVCEQFGKLHAAVSERGQALQSLSRGPVLTYGASPDWQAIQEFEYFPRQRAAFHPPRGACPQSSRDDRPRVRRRSFSGPCFGAPQRRVRFDPVVRAAKGGAAVRNAVIHQEYA